MQEHLSPRPFPSSPIWSRCVRPAKNVSYFDVRKNFFCSCRVTVKNTSSSSFISFFHNFWENFSPDPKTNDHFEQSQVWNGKKILPTNSNKHSYFLKMAFLGLCFNLFSSFQTNITILTTNICEKSPSSIRCWDSNPRPFEHESPPITTRSGLRSYLNRYEWPVPIGYLLAFTYLGCPPSIVFYLLSV